MKTQIWFPPVATSWVGWGSAKDPWPLPAFLPRRNMHLQPPTCYRYFRSSSHVTGTFWAAVQLWNSEWVSPRKFVHGPFKSNACNSNCPVLATIPAGGHSQKLWELLIRALVLWGGCQVWYLDPSLLRGHPHNQDLLLILCLCSSYQLWCSFIFTSLVIEVLFS